MTPTANVRGPLIRLDKAEKVKRFLETFCIQSKGKWHGKPLDFSSPNGLRWVWDQVLRPLYGTYRDDAPDKRQYSFLSLWCPKKNGKTSILSGLGLYHLVTEPGSEVYCLASDRNQARILWEQAAQYVDNCQQLKDRLKLRRSIGVIEDRKNHGVFQCLSKIPQRSGVNSSAVFYDELAEWPQANARDIWDRMRPSGMARDNPIQAVISTANYADTSSLGYEQFLYAQKVLTGEIIDPTTLPVVYALPQTEDWKDLENVKKVNPSWGITVSPDFYASELAKAKQSRAEERKYRVFYCCQWLAGSASSWLDLSEWEDCKADYTEKDFEGEDCYVGIDASRRHDLTSYTLVFPRNGEFYIFNRSFMPRENAARKEKLDKVPYSLWESQGSIVLTDGDVIDPASVRDYLLSDSKRFNFKGIYFDPHFFEESRQLLEAEGLELIEASQTPDVMSPPTARFERLVQERKIHHRGAMRDPVLAWCLGNAKADIDRQERVILSKRRSTGRIDAITSTIIALIPILAEERWAQSGFSVSF